MSAARALRVGVVGLGAWGREHVRAWRGLFGAELVAVCDTAAELAAAVAAEYGVPHAFTRPGEMAKAPLELDAVSVVTHEASHAEVASPFLQAGIPVLVEKPVALSLDEAEALVSEAERAGTTLMPGHLLRFDARLCALHERVLAGELGTLRSISARRLAPRSRHAKVSRSHPAVSTTIHDLDLLRWFFGEEPATVQAWARHTDGAERPDLLWSVVEFEGGQVGLTETGWVLPDGAGLWLESELEVIGTDGIARVHLPGNVLSLYLTSGFERPETSVLPGPEAAATGTLRDELAYFAGCVASNAPPQRADARDSLESLRLALAVAEAEGTGQSVQLSGARSTRP